MDMYLQIFVMGTLLVLVNCQLQPRLASSYLRRRRNALNHQDEYDNAMRYRKQLYDMGNEHAHQYEKNDDSYSSNENHGHMSAPVARDIVGHVHDDKIVAKRYAQPHFQEEEEHYAPPKYNFKYTVHDVEHHDIKHHQEERDGDNTVGEYSVLQPDGTVLTVRYSVHGDEGFNAVVSKAEYKHHYDH